MAKLKKMLGNIQSKECISMMALIETREQGHSGDLGRFLCGGNYLPIFEARAGESALFRETISACRACLRGERKLAEVKPALREAAYRARETEEPTAQAAARALSVACAAIRTPTNTLGFLFYGAAARAYFDAGLGAGPEVYDALAAREFERALASLRAAAVPDEPNPAKIKWGC